MPPKFANFVQISAIPVPKNVQNMNSNTVKNVLKHAGNVLKNAGRWSLKALFLILGDQSTISYCKVIHKVIYTGTKGKIQLHFVV